MLQVAKEYRRRVTFAIANKDEWYDELKAHGLENAYNKKSEKPMVAALGKYGEKYAMDWEFK